jgi:hypothetical protein
VVPSVRRSAAHVERADWFADLPARPAGRGRGWVSSAEMRTKRLNMGLQPLDVVEHRDDGRSGSVR